MNIILNLNEPLSQSTFAELVGVSEAAVSDWLREGRLQRGATGRDWVQAYCARLREQAAGRDPSGQLTEQRARLARAQADRIELENDVQAGRLVAVDQIEPAWAGMVVWLREQLMAQGAELAPRLAGLPASELRRVLDAANAALLNRFADADEDEFDDCEQRLAGGSGGDEEGAP